MIDVELDQVTAYYSDFTPFSSARSQAMMTFVYWLLARDLQNQLSFLALLTHTL